MEKQLKKEEVEILASANRLSAAGLRQAALDILLEFSCDHPHSARVFAAIGRLYLLEKQYPESVRYLRESIRIFETSKSKSSVVDVYAEAFDDEDLAYIEKQNPPPETEKPDYVFEHSPPAGGSIFTDEAGSLDEPELDGRVADGEAQPGPSFLEDLPQNFEIDSRNEVGFEEGHYAKSEPVYPKEVLLAEDEFEPTLATIDEVIEKELALAGHSDEITEITADDELLGDDIYVESNVELAPDEANELSWEEIDDLDNFGTVKSESIEPVVAAEGALTREQRAKQVAVAVVEKFELERDFLPLLQTIFFENGWSAARVAIERALTRGALREEIVLAREVRHFWWESDRYWTTFRSLYSNGMNQQAEATYRIMSWAEALRLVACFPNLPSMEEIEDLVEDAFQLWYNSKRLRYSFPVFFKFLKYRTGSMPGTLSSWEPRCFNAYEDDGVEDPLFKGNGAEEELRRQLWEFGVDIFKARDYDTNSRHIHRRSASDSER